MGGSMSGNLRLYNSGGYVELQAPSDATSQTLVLPTDSIQPALIHIVTQSFNSVSSVSIDNCFSSIYDRYRILVNADTTVTAVIGARLRLSGTDSSSGYSGEVFYGYSTVVGAANLSTNIFHMGNSEASTNYYSIDLSFPSQPRSTLWLHTSHRNTGSGAVGVSGSRHSIATSYDGLTLLVASGTLTGKISIYAYKNS